MLPNLSSEEVRLVRMAVHSEQHGAGTEGREFAHHSPERQSGQGRQGIDWRVNGKFSCSHWAASSWVCPGISRLLGLSGLLSFVLLRCPIPPPAGFRDPVWMLMSQTSMVLLLSFLSISDSELGNRDGPEPMIWFRAFSLGRQHLLEFR